MSREGTPSSLVWLAFATLYSALTVAYAWPLLGVLSSALPNDAGDPGLNAWIMWWNASALPLTERWWNAPIFVPLTGAFAFSETLLGLAVVTSPLIWAGATPVAAYNVAFLLSYPATALAAHALAHRLSGRHDAALLAGLAFGFSPYRAAQIPHIQMLWAMWMPLCLLALHRYLDGRRARDLVLAAGCWLLNALSSGYYLAYFPVLVGLWMLWFVRSVRSWIAISATLAASTLLLAPLLLGYAHHQSPLGLSRHFNEVVAFSADVTGFWSAVPPVWLPRFWTTDGRPEGELYAGIVVLLLPLTAGLLAWRRAGAAWRDRSALCFYTAGALAMALFALGPIGHAFGEPVLDNAPYSWLMALPGFDGLRVPARFAMLMCLCLSVAAAAAFARLTPLGARPGLAAALGLAIFLDGWVPSLRVAPVRLSAGMPAQTDRRLPLVELPIVDVFSETAAMLRATVHGHPLIGGFSGYTPAHYHVLVEGLAARDPATLEALSRLGPYLVLVRNQSDPGGAYADFVRRGGNGRYLSRTAVGPLFHVRGRPAPPPPDPAPELQLDYVTVSSHGQKARWLLDREPGTWWDTAAPQSRSDRMVLVFAQPVALTRVQLDLGPAVRHYPRRLRIETADEGVPPVVVWDGRTAGLALLGALEDHRRAPITIDLPPGSVGRRFALTTIERHRRLPWAVAEVRVFGRPASFR